MVFVENIGIVTSDNAAHCLSLLNEMVREITHPTRGFQARRHTLERRSHPGQHHTQCQSPTGTGLHPPGGRTGAGPFRAGGDLLGLGWVRGVPG